MADGELNATITDGGGRVLFSSDISKLPPGALVGASDADFARAAAFVVASGNASTSALQREMAVGYNRAAAWIERMEALGLVGQANHAGKRVVLDNEATAAIKSAIIAGGAGAPAPHPTPPEPGSAAPADAAFGSDPDVITVAAQGRLRSFVDRIERLEEDKAAISGDLKEVYAEAKGEGFDTKILRKVIRLRKTDKVKREEEEALLDLYLSAIGAL